MTEGLIIAAVVVTYNRESSLRQAISALLLQDFRYIIVIDNASTDGTAEYLSRIGDDRVFVERLSSNVGGAGGFYAGCKLASSLDVDWIVLQDDDAWPAPTFVERLREIASHAPSDVGGLAAAVRSPSGVIVEMNRPSVNPFKRTRDLLQLAVMGRRSLHISNDAYSGGQTDVDCVSFVGYAIRADLVGGSLGLPRAEFFIYADDQDYSFRLRGLGLRNVFDPALEYTHDCTTYLPTRALAPMWRVYYLSRNSLEFYRLIAGRWFPLVVPIKLIGWVLRVRRYGRSQRGRYLRVVTAGVIAGLRRDFSLDHLAVVELSQQRKK